jgi:hypothetical protein
LSLSLSPDWLRTVLAVTGALRRAKSRRALDGKELPAEKRERLKLKRPGPAKPAMKLRDQPEAATEI